MHSLEWSAAVVEATTGASPPSADEWTPVEVPGVPTGVAETHPVAYRTSFADPRESDETRALISVEDPWARCRVWLNGDLLGTHDKSFGTARFIVEPERNNELVIECLPPADRFGGVRDTDAVPQSASVPCVHGDVTVTGLAEVALLRLDVTPRYGAEGAIIEARVAIDCERDVDDTVTFSLRPVGFQAGATMERASVTASAGDRVTITHDVEVREPRSWYPRGTGPQHRYALTARFGNRELTRTTGLCTVEKTDDWFVINDRRVRLRGYNRLPGADPVADVERAVEAGANLIRAHAHVPSHRFHTAADEAGLVVFQDLPLTGPGGYDIDRGRELATALNAELNHHPSVLLFGVHDDPRDVIGGPIGTGRTGRARLRWRLWRGGEYSKEADTAVGNAFPADALVYPVCSGIGDEPDATHLYPGWSYLSATDIDWLLDRNPSLATVVTEFGAGSLAESDPPDDVAGFSESVHDARVNGGPSSSQQYQATVLKTVAEELRTRQSLVLAAFALRDTDSGAGMGVLANDGSEKVAFEALSNSYAPVVPILDAPQSNETVGTTIVNDTGATYSGTVRWSADTEAGEGTVEVAPFETADGPSVTIPAGTDVVDLSLQFEGDTIRNRYRR